MALHASAKLHATLLPTECIPFGSPFFTSSLAAGAAIPLAPALSNRPASLYSVNTPPSLRLQNAYGSYVPTYACEQREPHLFHSATSPWEATNKALWLNNSPGADHYKAKVDANSCTTQRSTNVHGLSSSPSLCPVPQMQRQAPQETARGPQGIHTSERREYTNVRNTGEEVAQFPPKNITQTTQKSYLLAPDAQPRGTAGLSLPRVPQDPVERSYTLPHKPVFAETAPSRDVAVGSRQSAGPTSSCNGSEGAAIQGLLGPLVDLPVNPGNHRSNGKGELREINSQRITEQSTLVNYNGFAGSHGQLLQNLCSTSSQRAETRTPLQQQQQQQQERASNCGFRPCEGEKQQQRQVGGISQQVYPDSMQTSVYASNVLPTGNETTEKRPDCSSPGGKCDGVDSRESTSSTASPSTKEFKKNASSNIKLDYSSSGTSKTEIGKHMRAKEQPLRTDAEQGQTSELAPRTPLFPGHNRSESYQLSENHTNLEAQVLLDSQRQSSPMSARSHTRQRNSRAAAGERTFAPERPTDSLSSIWGHTAHPQNPVENRHRLLDERQSEYTGASLVQSPLSSTYQEMSLQSSSQQALSNVQHHNVVRSTYTVQPHTASEKSVLPSAGHTSLPQRSSPVSPIQSRESSSSKTCAPLATHQITEVNNTRRREATSLKVGYRNMTKSDADGRIRGSAFDQRAFVSKWRDPSDTDGTQHTVTRGYFQRKVVPAKTKDMRRNCSVLRPVFKRTVHRVQTSAVVGADGRTREQIRNRVVLERVASAGVTAAAATAAGTLVASTSPAIAGLAVAGVAALLTGLAAASATADTPQCYRRQHTRQAPAAPYSACPRYSTQSRQRTPQQSGPVGKNYTAVWSQEAVDGMGKDTFQKAPHLTSMLLRSSAYGTTTQGPISRSRTLGPHSGPVTRHLPTPELLATKSYGTAPCTRTLLLVGRPMKGVLGVKP